MSNNLIKSHYRKGPFPRRAIKKKIAYFEQRNDIEQWAVTPRTIERSIRASLQLENPELSNAEIERRVARRMQRGMRPVA